MKPLRLTISGFITYRDTEVIDFTRFDRENLFIICGPTGSGKSTIFDAMTYALYGAVSTGARSAGADGEPRCHYLSEEDPETYVELVFQVRDKTYRVLRTPQQSLIKHRKYPVLYERKAELFLVEDGKETHLATKIKEVDGKLEEILGLTRDQFTKIVLLPQGEFSEFLSAGSDTKLAILGRIFSTEAFRRLEQQLQSETKKAAESVTAVEKEVDTYAALLDEKAKEALSACFGEKGVDPVFYGDFLEGLGKLEEERSEEKKRLDEMNAKAEEAFRSLSIALTAAAEKNKKIEEYRALCREQTSLAEKRHEYEELRKRLVEAEKLAPLELLEKAVDQDEQSEQKTRREWENAQKTMADARERHKRFVDEYGKLPDRTAELEVWKKRVRVMEEDFARYNEITSHDLQIKELERKRKEFSEKLKNYRRRYEEAKKSLDEMKDPVAEKNSLEKEQRADLVESARASSRKKLVGDLYLTTKKICDMAKDIEVQEKNFAALEREEEQANRRLEKLTAAQEGALFSRHAKGLTEGAPCPLCGAIHHPRPYEGAEVFDETIQAKAREAYQETRTRLVQSRTSIELKRDEIRKARDERKEKRKELETLQFPVFLQEDEQVNLKRILEWGTGLARRMEDLEKRTKARENAIETAEKNQELREKLREKVENVRNEWSEVEAEVKGLAEQIEFIDGERKKKQALRKSEESGPELKESIAEWNRRIREEDKAIADVQKNYTRAYSAYTGAAAALEQLEKSLETAKNRREESVKAFHKRVEETFGDVDKYETCRQEAPRILSRKDETEKYFERVLRLEERIHVLKDDYENAEPVDTESLTRQVEVAKERREETGTLRENHASLLSSIRTVREKTAKTLDGYEQAIQRRKQLATLDNIARGLGRGSEIKGTEKIDFETYVLMYYFDGVLGYANKRLSAMTQGQYEMIRRSDIASRQGKQGLDIDVLDTNTGKERSSATLSGGERFLASLSLALGMSDEMSGATGAIDIDTLFVDEGFGTLDQDVLQNAIDCLQDLTGDHRLVGIISHVEELKDRIPNKIVVTYDKEKGSTLQVIAG